MSAVGLVTHPACLEHDPGPGHPERPARLRAVLERLRADGLEDELAVLEARPATAAELLLAHTPDHVSYVESVCRRAGRGRALVDGGDTWVGGASHEAALRAAGGVIEAAARVHAGDWRSAFVAVRPPGHHAEEGRAMGFCLYNNVALAALWLRAHGIERVAIVDWDVHHGNGTQHLFEADASVFYASLHRFPFYPGTGAASERGRGAGVGTTLNCPLPAGTGDAEWLAAFEGEVLRALEDFAPQFLLVSAGFDAHARDPLGGLRLTRGAYAEMTRGLLDVAARHAGGRVVSVLEGGYDLEALGASASAHVAQLLAGP
jgi:acetoin utilization deacetylase AcuC-like enzyme